jgi:hypothetical protein
MLRSHERSAMPNAKQIWDHLVDEAGDEAIENAIAGPNAVADAEKALTEAGFDTRAERARAAVIIAQLTGERHLATAPEESANEAPDGPADSAVWVRGSAPATGEARVGRTPRSLFWLVAALVAAATTGGILYAVGHRSNPQDKPVEPPREVPSAPTASATAAPLDPAASPAKPRKVPGYTMDGKPETTGR